MNQSQSIDTAHADAQGIDPLLGVVRAFGETLAQGAIVERRARTAQTGHSGMRRAPRPRGITPADS